MINYKGLRKRPTYDELVYFIETDPERIHYPDRTATQLRESHYLTQLDGEGMQQMDSLHTNRMKEQQKRHILQDMADQTGKSINEIIAGQATKAHDYAESKRFNLFGDDPPTESDGEDDDYYDSNEGGAERATQTASARMVELASQTDDIPIFLAPTTEAGYQTDMIHPIQTSDGAYQTDPIAQAKRSDGGYQTDRADKSDGANQTDRADKSDGGYQTEQSGGRTSQTTAQQTHRDAQTDLASESAARAAIQFSAEKAALRSQLHRSQEQHADDAAKHTLEIETLRRQTEYEKEMTDKHMKQVEKEAERQRKLIDAASKAHAREKVTMVSEAEAARRAKARDVEDMQGRTEALRLAREEMERDKQMSRAQLQQHMQDLQAKSDALQQRSDQLQQSSKTQDDSSRDAAEQLRKERADIEEVKKRLLAEADHAKRTAHKLHRESKAQPEGSEKKLKRSAPPDVAYVQPGVAASSNAQAAPAAAAPAAPAAAAAAAQHVGWVFQSVGKWKRTTRPILIQQLQLRNNPMPGGWNTKGHVGYLKVDALAALIISRTDHDNSKI